MSKRLHFLKSSRLTVTGRSAVILFLIFTSGISFSQDPKNLIDIVFLGDIMQHGPQIRSAYNPAKDSYNYSPCFRYIAPSIRQADIAIANLEVTLAGPPYSGYPTFSSPDELAVASKNAGIDILVTANNHSLDRRKKGLERTIDVLDSLNIPHTGTFKNQAERDQLYPLIIEKKGIKIALLNYTYGTNGIPVTPPNVVNFIDTTLIKADIAKAIRLEADFTIVYFHWGYEYNSLPNDEQKVLAAFARKSGADMVIGAHPHVLQPMEFEDGFFTVYSLGNFVSNQRDRYKDGGMIARATLEIDEDTRKVKAVHAGYQLVWVYKKAIAGNSEYYVLPADDYLSKSLIFDQENREKMQLFVEDSRALFAKNNKGNVREYRYIFSYMPTYDWMGNLKSKAHPAPNYEKNPKPVITQHKTEPAVATEKPRTDKKIKNPSPKSAKKETYRIQFFVSSGKLEPSELKPEYFSKVYTEKVDGLTRYLIGDFNSKEEAEQQLSIIVNETRFKDAYVVER